MLLDENGKKIHLNDLVGVLDNTKLKDRYVVKVVREELIVGYKEYDEYPTKEQIMWCIGHFNGDSAYTQRKFVMVQGAE